MKAALKEDNTNKGSENGLTNKKLAIALLFRNEQGVVVKELVGLALMCFGVAPPKGWDFRDVSTEEFMSMVPWPLISNARTGEKAKEISKSQIPIFLNFLGLVLGCIEAKFGK